MSNDFYIIHKQAHMTKDIVQGANCLYLLLCRRRTVVEGVYRCDIKHRSFLGNKKDEKVLGDKFNQQGRTELCRLAIEITHLKNE